MKIIVDQDITLCKIRMKSANDIFECIERSRDNLREWLPWVDDTKSPKDTEKYIREVNHSKYPEKQLVFEVIFQNQIAGLIGLKSVDSQNNKAELGYWLGNEAVGKGVMTRSSKAVLDHAFQELDLNRVQLKCAVNNIRSCNIPKQLGFSFEGIERQGELVHGRYYDLKVYSILRKEWQRK